jgi:hypothetical protein
MTQTSNITIMNTNEQCIQCLKDQLSYMNQPSFTTQQAATVYMASMHLLCTLKNEQQCIERYRYVCDYSCLIYEQVFFIRKEQRLILAR